MPQIISSIAQNLFQIEVCIYMHYSFDCSTHGCIPFCKSIKTKSLTCDSFFTTSYMLKLLAPELLF